MIDSYEFYCSNTSDGNSNSSLENDDNSAEGSLCDYDIVTLRQGRIKRYKQHYEIGSGFMILPSAFKQSLADCELVCALLTAFPETAYIDESNGTLFIETINEDFANMDIKYTVKCTSESGSARQFTHTVRFQLSE